MGNRINTVMQPCFFQLSGVLPADEAIARIKACGDRDVREARARRSWRATTPRSTGRWSGCVHVPLGVPSAPEVPVSPDRA